MPAAKRRALREFSLFGHQIWRAGQWLERKYVIMRTMKNIIQYRITKGDTYYVAEGLDLPVVTQGRTLDELAKNIQEATELCLDGEDPADFGLAPASPMLINFELPRSLAHA